LKRTCLKKNQNYASRLYSEKINEKKKEYVL